MAGIPRVQAVCDFVHNHIVFNYGNARPTRTAAEAYREQSGVCRDFAHLAVAFCRALNIPTRYCTGYISDIGATSAATHWAFAAGGAFPTFAEFIAVTNEATTDVRVDVTGAADGVLDALPGLSGIRIPRGGRAVFYIGDHGVQGDRPLIVNASGPVVVERTTFKTNGVGASAVIGAVLVVQRDDRGSGACRCRIRSTRDHRPSRTAPCCRGPAP